MPQALELIRQKVAEFWSSLDKGQKSRILLSVGLVFVVVVGVLIFSLKTTYVPVFTITNGKDLPTVEKALADKKITYKPGDSGKILVDEKDKNAAEFAIATIPGLSSSVSFDDAWNKIKMGSTESDKKKLWEDFKRSSLIAKLKMFDNVADADVDMSIPEKSMYFGGDSKDKPTAYVRIKPKGEITPEQVQGVISVVAASIEGIQRSDVTVVDSNFNLLTQDTGDSEMDRTSSQYKMRIKIKAELENNVKKLYSGNSDNYDYINVVANPVLDFDKQKSLQTDLVKPTNIDEAIVSETTSKEKLTNGAPGGQPGILSNPTTGTNPSYPTSGDSSNSNYDKSTVTKNRDFGKVQTESEKALGGIKNDQSSMSVTLWYGKRVTDDTKINQAFIDQIRADVSLATGILPAKISVSKYKMAPVEETKRSVAEIIREILDNYGLAVLLLVMTGLIVFVIPKKFAAVAKPGEMAAVAAAAVEDDFVGELEADKKTMTSRQIEDFIKRRPDAVAQLLRNWLKEDWE